MTQAIDEAVKALTEFEAALDFAKGEAADARRLLTKSAATWSAEADAEAVGRAKKIADSRLRAAREDAEKEAETIRASGRAALENFHATIEAHKDRAADIVVDRLVGARA